MARRRDAQFHIYECTLTGEKFKVYGKAENPDDLVSVQAYYDMNPEEDDRPADIKKQLLAES